MRDGRTVAAGEVAQTSIDELIALMVGRKVEELYPHVPHAIGPTVLDVRALSGPRGKPDRVSLAARRGEILGLGGLVGSGRSELLRAIFGLHPALEGQIAILPQSARNLAHTPPAVRQRLGLGFASEDRKGEGLALRLSVAENIALPALERAASWNWLWTGKMRKMSREAAQSLSTVYRDINQRAGDLSGGNQQKIALARLLFTGANVLLLDEPTRGIDVGSKAIVYQWLGRAAAQGKTIVLTSSYIPELLGLCDRIGVMYRGRLAALGARRAWTEEKLLLAATTGANPLGEQDHE
jgi:ribose transport system ATP-binding protein